MNEDGNGGIGHRNGRTSIGGQMILRQVSVHPAPLEQAGNGRMIGL